MRQHVTGTIAARLFVTAMNLLVMVLAGHVLGAAGLGIISLVVLGITLVMLPTNLIGGGALVYLVPRTRLWNLLRPAYAWAIISTVLCVVLLRVFPVVPVGYEYHLCALAFLQALYTIHLGVLLGQQRIARHNIILSVHAATLLAVFAALLWPDRTADPISYVHASYAAFGLTVVLSAMSMRWAPPPAVQETKTLRRLLKQGMLVQGANGLQLLNYRLAYWVIEHAQGRAALGLYSVANQLAESAWIAPRSLGFLLLSRVSNITDQEHQRTLTLFTVKVAVALAAIVVIGLAIVPDILFSMAFGEEIRGLRPILLLLAPGILAMAASQAFSHYFSGTAQNGHNLIGSGLGMLVTVGLGFWLVPELGLRGAAITASAAYLSSLLYQVVTFVRATHTPLAELLPQGSDLRRARDLLRGWRL